MARSAAGDGVNPRRRFLGAACLALLAGRAQTQPRIARLGYLSTRASHSDIVVHGTVQMLRCASDSKGSYEHATAQSSFESHASPKPRLPAGMNSQAPALQLPR